MNAVIVLFSVYRFYFSPYFYPYAISDTEKFYPFYTYLTVETRDIGVKGLGFSFSGNHFYSDTISELKLFGFNIFYDKSPFSINIGRSFVYYGLSSFIDGIKFSFTIDKFKISIYGGKRAFLPFKLNEVLFEDSPQIYGIFLKYILNKLNFSIFYNIEKKDTVNFDYGGFSVKFNDFLYPSLTFIYSFQKNSFERVETKFKYILKKIAILNFKYYFESNPFKHLYYIGDLVEKKTRHRFFVNAYFKKLHLFTPIVSYRLTLYEERSNYVYFLLRKKYITFGIGYGNYSDRTQILYFIDLYHRYKEFLFRISYKTFDDADYNYYLNSLRASVEFVKFKNITLFSEFRFFSNPDYNYDIRVFLGLRLKWEG